MHAMRQGIQRRHTVYLLVPLVLVCTSSCALFKKAAQQAAEGFADRSAELAAAGGEVAQAVRDTVAGDKASVLIQKLLEDAGVTLNEQAQNLRDSLLDESTASRVRALRDDVLGSETQELMGKLREELIGKETEIAMARIRNELLGAQTRLLLRELEGDVFGDAFSTHAKQLRDDLFGPATEDAINTLVREAVRTLREGYEKELLPVVRREGDFLARHAKKIVVSAGAVIGLIVLGCVWLLLRFKRQRRVLEVVTSQIHRIPQKESYDELTDRIKNAALQAGLETNLRSFLGERGMLEPASE